MSLRAYYGYNFRCGQVVRIRQDWEAARSMAKISDLSPGDLCSVVGLHPRYQQTYDVRRLSDSRVGMMWCDYLELDPFMEAVREAKQEV